MRTFENLGKVNGRTVMAKINYGFNNAHVTLVLGVKKNEFACVALPAQNSRQVNYRTWAMNIPTASFKTTVEFKEFIKNTLDINIAELEDIVMSYAI